MKRLFFAFWPDDNIRHQCCEVMHKIPQGLQKSVKPNNLHVTLLFLGCVTCEQEAAITIAAAGININSKMSLVFDRLSFWKKPGVLCLTSTYFDSEIVTLVEQLQAIAGHTGIQIEERMFKPHITLARKAGQSVNVEFSPITWRAEDFCLVESCSLADGVEYRVIGRWR